MVTQIDYFIEFPRTVPLVPLHSALLFLTKNSIVYHLQFKPNKYYVKVVMIWCDSTQLASL